MIVYKFGHMCHYIVRYASNVFDPLPFTDVESLGFVPPQRSEISLRCRTIVYCAPIAKAGFCAPRKKFSTLYKAFGNIQSGFEVTGVLLVATLPSEIMRTVL